MTPFTHPAAGAGNVTDPEPGINVTATQAEQAPGRASQARRPSRGLRRWIGWALWAFVGGLVILTFCARLTGLTNWVVVAGHSMEPNFYTGDLILLWNTESWEVGDTVMYSIDIGGASNYNIIHRLVSGDPANGWHARGDNKPDEDPWIIPQANVAGEEILRVPAVGNLMTVVRGPTLLAIAAGVFVAMAVLAKPGANRRGNDMDGTTTKGRRRRGRAT